MQATTSGLAPPLPVLPSDDCAFSERVERLARVPTEAARSRAADATSANDGTADEWAGFSSNGIGSPLDFFGRIAAHERKRSASRAATFSALRDRASYALVLAVGVSLEKKTTAASVRSDRLAGLWPTSHGAATNQPMAKHQQSRPWPRPWRTVSCQSDKSSRHRRQTIRFRRGHRQCAHRQGRRSTRPRRRHACRRVRRARRSTRISSSSARFTARACEGAPHFPRCRSDHPAAPRAACAVLRDRLLCRDRSNGTSPRRLERPTGSSSSQSVPTAE